MEYNLSALNKFFAAAYKKKTLPSYQQAEIVNGRLCPTGWSEVKYNEISEAAEYLGKDFTFTDFGCSHGLFSFLLKQDFDGVMGKMVNNNKDEIDVCAQGIKQLKIKGLEAVHMDVLKYHVKADLTIYMSLIRHLLNAGASPCDVADLVVGQTGVIAVVEGKVVVEDTLAVKRYPDETAKIEVFLDALRMRMKIISKSEMNLDGNVARVCYIFKK